MKRDAFLKSTRVLMLVKVVLTPHRGLQKYEQNGVHLFQEIILITASERIFPSSMFLVLWVALFSLCFTLTYYLPRKLHARLISFFFAFPSGMSLLQYHDLLRPPQQITSDSFMQKLRSECSKSKGWSRTFKDVFFFLSFFLLFTFFRSNKQQFFI